MDFRPLTQEQIQQLVAQFCTADNWQTVFVAPACDVGRIRNVRLSGEIRLGSNMGTIAFHGVKLPCGVYDATLSDCTVGPDARIAGVRSGISRYVIGEGALIQDVGLLAAEPGATFGNGIELNVVNEAGGRGTLVFNRLTSQVAYLHAMLRHDSAFIEHLSEIIRKEIAGTSPKEGIVGDGARIVGCGTLLNVVVGAWARIEGTALLEDGTVNSCREQPTIIGTGVHAKEFVVAEGARVESGAMLEKVFVGQGVRMGKQYSAENSVFFANCEAFHGEGVSLFAGPYTVTHHKSTLMIAGLFSFYNAGSGTNQSNHMYKLGPVHQGIFERGCKTGSFSYVLFESHIGAFSVVIGKHQATIRIPNLPFSYVGEKGGESSVFPGMNLFSIGTVRDGEKWPKRDHRKTPEKRDLIIFNVFSPYTVEKMRRGRDELLALNDITPKDRASVLIGGVLISRGLLRKGAKNYQSAVARYLYDHILSRLTSALTHEASWDAALASLRPATRLTRSADWTDLSGLLTPVELVRNLEARIASGDILSYDALLAALQELHDRYQEYEWQYVVETFESETGVPLARLTAERALALVEEWQKAATSLQSSILEDSRKEFGPVAKIGYGLDLGEAEADRDFAAVRGTAETNSVVRRMTGEAEDIARRAAAYRQQLAALK